MAEETKKLEDILDELEVTVGRLETEEMSLEDSFQCFSKGMELVNQGNKAIDQVEKQMQMIMGEAEDEI